MTADVIYMLPEAGEDTLAHDVIVDAADFQRFIAAGGMIYKRGFRIEVRASASGGSDEHVPRNEIVASAMIHVPEHPRTGDVVTWWTLQPHPIHFYIQSHRAEFYQRATCAEVLGPTHVRGEDFVDEWLVTSWYEPSGGTSAGGRTTTAGLRAHLSGEDRQSGICPRATFGEVRDLLVAHHEERSAHHRREAEDCDRRATAARGWTEPPLRERVR